MSPEKAFAYVALPFDVSGWPERLREAREVCAGIVRFVHGEAVVPHAHLPHEGTPTPDDLRCIGRRMLEGDGLLHRRATFVVACGDHPTVDEQIGWAKEIGLPVFRYPTADLGALRLAGALAATADQPVPAPTYLRATAAERRERWTADSVLRTWLQGATPILGCRALPLPPPDGQGDRHARKQAIELCGLRLAAADGIVKQAQRSGDWTGQTEQLLRAVLLAEVTYAVAAEQLGLSGAVAAWRMHDRARAAVARVLKERAAASPSSGEG